MLKSVKIDEKAYKDAKKLSSELEKEELIEGLYNVKLSTAIGYAIKKTLQDIKNRKRFLSAAESWKDIDENLVKALSGNYYSKINIVEHSLF